MLARDHKIQKACLGPLAAAAAVLRHVSVSVSYIKNKTGLRPLLR